MESTAEDSKKVILDFADNRVLGELFGAHDRNLALLEERLDIVISSRGNRVSIVGAPDSVEVGRAVLRDLYGRLLNGLPVDEGEVEGAVRMAVSHDSSHGSGSRPGSGLGADWGAEGSGPASLGEGIRTRKRYVTARSPAQAAYIRAIRERELVFALGPAGTGKTYIAVAAAVSKLIGGEVDRVILSRPAVEAGENIGFLPGDMREKIDPYLRPLYDALHDMLPGEQVVKYLSNGDIEVAPLGFMRGRTLSNAFVILDEAQNTTPMQMKMLLTRLGENSQMVVAGDPTQVDLPRGARSGLIDAVDIVESIEDISVVRFSDVDVVRHSLVTKLVQAYNERDRQRQAARARKEEAGEARSEAGHAH